MLLIQRANETAHNLQLHLERESRNRSSSFFMSLKDLFFTNPVDCGEYSLEERRKVSAYLETSLYQLSHIFEVRNIPSHVFSPCPSIVMHQWCVHCYSKHFFSECTLDCSFFFWGGGGMPVTIFCRFVNNLL
jgi:hypothetical protein